MLDKLLVGNATDDVYLALYGVTRGRGWGRVPVAFALFTVTVMWLTGTVIAAEFGTPVVATITIAVTVGAIVGVAVCVVDNLPAQRELEAARVLIASGMRVDEAARRSVEAGVAGRHAIIAAVREGRPVGTHPDPGGPTR